MIEAQEKQSIIKPITTVKDAVEVFGEYQQLKDKLKSEGDFVVVYDQKGNKKEIPTKQWTNKLIRFFGVSIQILKDEIIKNDDGTFTAIAVVRAIAPNGMYVDGDGACWSETIEKYDKKGSLRDIYHLARSRAITRARKKAVLTLAGFEDVDNEDIEEEKEIKEEQKQEIQKPEPQKQTTQNTGQIAYKELIEKVKQVIDIPKLHQMLGIDKNMPSHIVYYYRLILKGIAEGQIDVVELERLTRHKKFSEMSPTEAKELYQKLVLTK